MTFFDLKEAEGRKHRGVRAVEGKKKLHYLRCRCEELVQQSARCVSRPEVGQGESRKR